MSVTQTIIAGRHWLAPDAAASYQRMRRDGCPPGITDAGRTRAEQQRLWERYLRGELVATAARPGTSLHETGLALDIPEPARAWVRAHGEAYGWIKDVVRNEPWHMTYVPARDTHPGSVVALPADLPEDSMRRTTHTRTKPAALPLGWKTLPVNDKGHTSACTVVGRGTLVADLTLAGVPRGREVQVRAIVVESDADGKNAKIIRRGSIVEIIGTGGSTFGQIVAPFELAKINGKRQRRVRIQALTLDKGIRLTHLTTTVDYIPA